MRSLGGRWARGARAGAVVIGLLSCVATSTAGATGAADCTLGRSLLDCTEKVGIYYDSVNWAIGGLGALGLFQAPRPLHLNNPALAQFWRFEAATSITRYEFELGIENQSADGAFEDVPVAPSPPAPVVNAHGLVTRRMAAAMTRLMRAEQQETVNLVAMDVALNRATYALQVSRRDWAAYQAYVAAGFARRAADAITRVIPAQRGVTTALVRSRLLFGVGPADGRAAQRYVRKHGFPTRIQQVMVSLGMNPITLALVKYAFVHAKLGSTTYSMSRYLSSGSVIAAEKRCRNVLRHFAKRIPTVAQPA